MKKPFHQLFNQELKRHKKATDNINLVALWYSPNSPLATTPILPSLVPFLFKQSPLYVAMVGSRDYGALGSAGFAIDHLRKRINPKKPIVVVSGGARGIDRISEDTAKGLQMPVVSFKPEYDLYPPYAAPMIRNEDIIYHSHCTIAFGVTKGTMGSVTLTGKYKHPLLHFRECPPRHVDWAVDNWLFSLLDDGLLAEDDIMPVKVPSKKQALLDDEINNLLF